MKKITLILAAFTIAYSFSAPMYYTFSGKVSLIPSDVGGYIAAHGIKSGTPVTYILMVDTARNAYTRFNGITSAKPDSHDSGTGYQAKNFFDSLVAPSVFSPAVTDTTSGSFWGYHTVTKVGQYTRNSVVFETRIGNLDHGTDLIIYIRSDTVAANFLPKVGDAVLATEDYSDSAGTISDVNLTLTLTAISSTKPSSGLRSSAKMPSIWLNAELHEGALILQNHSGKKAMAKVIDASGKTVIALSMGDKAAIPLSSLPHGSLFLEVTTTGQGEPFMQPFSH